MLHIRQLCYDNEHTVCEELDFYVVPKLCFMVVIVAYVSFSVLNRRSCARLNAHFSFFSGEEENASNDSGLLYEF